MQDLQLTHRPTGKQAETLSLTGLTDFAVLIYLLGLVSSKALLGIGMGGLSIVAILYAIRHREAVANGPSFKPFLYPCLIFLITLLSGINSADLSEWGAFVSKKLPFLILPVVFYTLRDHFSKRYLMYLACFVILVSLVSLGVLANYLMHFESVNAAIGKGRAIATPVDHTEFSLYVAFAAIVSLFIYLEPKKVINLGTKSTFLLLAIFLIIFLHILTVRSGLVVFYLSALLLLGRHFLLQKKYGVIAGLLAAFFIVPLLSINFVPSLKKKMDYVQWDFKQYSKDKGLTYSDSERIYSMTAGWEIFKTAPMVGIGIGDLKAECQAYYKQSYNKVLNHFPHNQYLFALAAAGVLGLIVYLIAILGPVFYFRQEMDAYMASLVLMILIAGLAENPMERTFSIGFYLFFALASTCYLTTKWARQKSSYHS